MTKLVNMIIEGNLSEASKIFNQRMNEISESKAHEVKKMIGAKISTAETQGPPQQIWVINRRNGIQYGEKPRLLKPKKIKKPSVSISEVKKLLNRA